MTTYHPDEPEHCGCIELAAALQERREEDAD